MGVKGEDALNWLKSFKDFKLDHIDFDTETEGLEEYDIADIAESQGVDIFNQKTNNEEPKDWIKIKGNPVPIFEGQSKDDAVKDFLSEKNNSKKKQYKKQRKYKRKSLSKEQSGVLSALRTINKEEWKNGKPFCHYWGNWIFTAIYLDDASDYDIIGIKEIK